MLRSTAGVIALCLMLSACGGVGETDAGPPGQSSGGTSNGTSTGTTTPTTGGTAIMSHNAGQDCISCHKAGGAGASKGIFTVAGTVYNNNGGAQNNATVSIYAAGTNNVQATLSTDGLGNFWTTQAIAALVPAAGQTLVQGVNAVVRPTGGASRSMLGVISNGSCNACHSSAGGVAKVTAQLLDSGPSVHTAAASGDGESGTSATAAAAESLPALAQIATGTAHGCVLKAAGSVLCWGANDLGQLGNGNTDAAQLSIVSLTGVTALNAAGDSTCARVGTGNATSFYCWGAGFGATPTLADVSAENAPAALIALRDSGPSLAHNFTAANVVGLESTAFTHIASAADHSCGITTDNHVKCWEGTHASVDIPLL